MMMRSLGASATGGFSTIVRMRTTPSASSGARRGRSRRRQLTSDIGTCLRPTTLPPVAALTSHIWCEQAAVAHDLVGQQHRERLVADGLARTADRVAEAHAPRPGRRS